MISDALSDPASVVAPVGVVALLATMLKMLWSDRTRGARIEKALRESFAKERTDREAEVTVEKASAKQDYSDRVAAHKEIHAREIAAFQERITGYRDELTETKERVAVLEAEVAKLRKQ